MSNTSIATTKKTEINTVRDALEKMKPQFSMALPKHITPDRLFRVAMTAIQTTPKLLECDRQSLYSAIMKAAQLGLEPDGILGQAYLIPYGKQVQFIPGYKGLIDLARRSGEVQNIIAKEVYEKDDFSVDWSKDTPFQHIPFLGDDRGNVTHFWALARFKDGGFHWDFMTRKEVETLRDKSNGRNNNVWKEHFIEMGKKTVIRRIAKFLPLNVQKASMFDSLQEAGKAVSLDDLGDIVIENDDGKTIEGSAEVVTDPVKTSKLDEFAGQEIKQEEPATLTLQDWLDEIANAPTAAGVEHKFNQAAALFKLDLDAVAALMNAKGLREEALKGGKKLFAKPEGEAA